MYGRQAPSKCYAVLPPSLAVCTAPQSSCKAALPSSAKPLPPSSLHDSLLVCMYDYQRSWHVLVTLQPEKRPAKLASAFTPAFTSKHGQPFPPPPCLPCINNTPLSVIKGFDWLTQAWASKVRAGKGSKGDRLGIVDHATINYPPFRKNFYIEVPTTPLLQRISMLRYYHMGVCRATHCLLCVDSWAICTLVFISIQTS